MAYPYNLKPNALTGLLQGLHGRVQIDQSGGGGFDRFQRPSQSLCTPPGSQHSTLFGAEGVCELRLHAESDGVAFMHPSNFGAGGVDLNAAYMGGNEQMYWLDLFTRKTWQEFLTAGASVSGFREGRWHTVQQMKPGDYLLCYLIGVSRWIGVLEVTSEPFRDSKRIWEDDTFPCRVNVRPVATLTPETAVPIGQLREQLTIFDPERPLAWVGHVRGSPTRWVSRDGEVVMQAVLEREQNPKSEPVRPPVPTGPLVRDGADTPVIVPEAEDANGQAREPSQHTEVQWLLLKLGNDIGMDVWVARNDSGRSYGGHAFADLPRLKRTLPVQFDEATTRTIELIDVLWLRGNAIVAAFEIECTTSIYSGLLRMADLVAMQPNLNIPLYLVAPDDRREKVINEVNRPTFSRLRPPLNEICRFISIPTLRGCIEQATPLLRHLRPEFLDDFAESCQVEAV